MDRRPGKKIGSFSLYTLNVGEFWLDGGAMFGIVPRVLWEKLNPPDEKNRIKLHLNCLLIEGKGKRVLIDTGIFINGGEKFNRIYKIKATPIMEKLKEINLTPNDIDIVVNSHLHFDHCGGNTLLVGNKFLPTFGRAKYFVQKEEWEIATNTNERTKGSYLEETFFPIEEKKQIELIKGEVEIISGIKLLLTGGHTMGHQIVKIEEEEKVVIYLADLIPTVSHLKIPYVMGYDLYPLTTIEKKRSILKEASKEGWVLIFEHDPKIVWGKVDENLNLIQC